MATFTVSWTDEESIDLNVEDYALTGVELRQLIREEISHILPGTIVDYDLEWEDPEPKVKESQLIPPDEFWFETIAGLAAANTTIVIFKGFNLPEKYKLGNDHWRQHEPETIGKINAILIDYKEDMPRHDGPFSSVYESLLSLKIVRARNGPGYLIDDNKLVGIIFPTFRSQ